MRRYDSYLDESHRDSGVGALGMGMMEDLDDDEEDPFDDPPCAIRRRTLPGDAAGVDAALARAEAALARAAKPRR